MIFISQACSENIVRTYRFLTSLRSLWEVLSHLVSPILLGFGIFTWLVNRLLLDVYKEEGNITTSQVHYNVKLSQVKIPLIFFLLYINMESGQVQLCLPERPSIPAISPYRRQCVATPLETTHWLQPAAHLLLGGCSAHCWDLHHGSCNLRFTFSANKK